ncbi:NADPH oxidase 4 [Strongylocentrotus purpuratus]|uniref:FAD-binding FR-type domain-containing protein n=1 Tax=Strongylocentrotus purpuratus TaxID=7668 RepID=A0A7M7PL88_STRPU|nr:NADPH oxidase 4 [Strongylocentrotus purpuratus]XP_030851095.1 NADPH oxidase 4 [Strongylocentrotus purpuratus]XP_030851096.1 NADPH oxidase 4 [Strongylocentrotus purpuratus]
MMGCCRSDDVGGDVSITTSTTGYYMSRNKATKHRSRFSFCGWFRNSGFKYSFSVLWVLINAAVFFSVYYHYKYESKYYYLREILGRTLCVSRASAALLNLNCAALLLPVCKHLAARLRRSKLSSRSMRRWLDHYRFTHIMCAGCVCIGTVIHCTAHSFNAVRFSTGFNSAFPDINIATFSGQNPCTMLLSTVAGITGSCMLCILIFIIITSLPCFRRERHNVFWMSHHAFLVFYILLLCHPLGGILKEQCNTVNHTPGCVYPDDPLPEPMSVKPDPNDRVEYTSRIIPHAEPSAVNSSSICREKPRFISHKSRTWRFLLVPASLYILDRVWRWIKSRRSVTIENLRFLPGDVIEFRLHVENFSAQPGQYILINCPAISRLEWHPFTLTSCPTPSNPSFSLQMKACGDWTDLFRQLLQERLKTSHGDDPYMSMPKILMDGPLGSASGDILRYRVSVCIAGGIGVTPFAAILNHLASLGCDELSRLKLSRLYFIWICRDESHFQWFTQTINSLQLKLWQMNRPDFLNLRLHTTGNISKSGWSESTDTQLCCSIGQGRPNLKDILNDVTICNPKQNIGVFVCGPRKMTSRVHRLCNRLNRNKAQLHFNQESFS